LKQDEDGKPSGVFNFFLDTTSVVRRGFLFTHAADIPGALLDAVYRRGAFNRFKYEERDVCTFYEGAMLRGNPTSEPFSFSPCFPWEEGNAPPRTRRPMIGALFGKYSCNGQAFTQIKDRSPLEAWQSVVQHCRISECLALKCSDFKLEGKLSIQRSIVRQRVGDVRTAYSKKTMSIRTMKVLGQNMAWLLKKLHAPS
jgi:hypothetical protein